MYFRPVWPNATARKNIRGTQKNDCIAHANHACGINSNEHMNYIIQEATFGWIPDNKESFTVTGLHGPQ